MSGRPLQRIDRALHSHMDLGEALRTAGDGHVVDRSQFNPARVPAYLLPWISKWLAVGDQHAIEDLECMVFGQELVNFFGQELTGRMLSDMRSKVRADYLMRMSQLCLNELRPVFVRSSVVFSSGDVVNTSHTLYPVRRRHNYSLLLLTQIRDGEQAYSGIPFEAYPVQAENDYLLLDKIGDWPLEEIAALESSQAFKTVAKSARTV